MHRRRIPRLAAAAALAAMLGPGVGPGVGVAGAPVPSWRDLGLRALPPPPARPPIHQDEILGWGALFAPPPPQRTGPPRRPRVGENLSASYRAGTEAMREGRYEEAAEHFQALAERRPDLALPRLSQARALALAGRCVRARAALARAAPDQLRPGQRAQAAAAVQARCGRGADGAGFALELGLPGRGAREAALRSRGPMSLALEPVGGRLALSPSDVGWGAARIEVTEAARLRPGLGASGRFTAALLTRADAATRARLEGGATLDDADAEMSLGFSAAVDLGAEEALGWTGVHGRAPAPFGTAVEIGGRAEGRRNEAGDLSGRSELRLALEAPAGRRLSLRAEGGHAISAAEGLLSEGWAGLVARRRLPGIGRMEVYGQVDLRRPEGDAWEGAAWQAGARLRPAWGPPALFDVGLARSLTAGGGTTMWMTLSREF